MNGQIRVRLIARVYLPRKTRAQRVNFAF